jgi:hypothetical protein
MKSSIRTALICHPATPTALVTQIEVTVRAAEAGSIGLTYILDGDLAALRIPAAAPPRRSDHLWLHTCFESFIKIADGPGYLEFNFSPSGEWAAYQFSRYRERMPPLDELPAPAIAISSSERRLELDLVISLLAFASMPKDSTLRLGLSAIIEEASGARSFWALRHPTEKPDFHNLDSFTLEVDPP